ncbi:MAG: XRE family transcriptional regulator [Candidatus Marinimicrobia bacterium]|nr:XRE family transcriptional regulator [Candidatus Neomarinimicrobiota bacterium]
MLRVKVKPELLRWAYERAGWSRAAAAEHIPALPAWEQGTAQPTLKQLEAFAQKAHVPIGFLFLPEPPVERLPIPDFRTMANAHQRHPSPDLLDTLYLCQQRQAWFQDYARAQRLPACPFVGTVTVADNPVVIAQRIREALGFDLEARRRARTWEDALRDLVAQTDETGVMVMVSGVVGSNTHRKLDPEEFRGFALADPLAPLVFINGADTKSAQMFTLAHELAHVWLGATGLSDLGLVAAPANQTETWCNQVAAETLVPLAAIRAEYRPAAAQTAEVARLARCFKVSTLVILRRLHDAGLLPASELWQAYHEELERLMTIPRGGGNFYLTQAARLSKRFAAAVATSALEGQASFTEAFRLLGIKRHHTFTELCQSLGRS